MPQTIHQTSHNAPDELRELRKDMAEMRQIVHQLAKAQTTPNPVQAAPSGESLLLKLLVEERKRAETRDAELRELQNPLHQMHQLQALAEFVQPQQDESSVLVGALEALGGVIAANMESKQQAQGSRTPDSSNAADGSDEY